MQLEKSKTLGEEALNLLKDPYPQEIEETRQEMQKDYIDELVKCAKRGEILHGKEKHFYLCVQTRRERHLPNVVRSQFYSRVTRPHPQYDLALYYYDPKDEQITFVWCIPDKDTVDYFAGHWAVSDEGKPIWVPPAKPDASEGQIASFCVSFRANTLI